MQNSAETTIDSSAQESVQRLLDQLVAEGLERGVQVAVYWRGQLAVDAWAGVADVRTGRAVEGDTLFPVFSVTKGITATLTHLLAERGVVSYDMPIADVWPEFKAHGKETITLRQALSHTSGIPHVPSGIGYPELADWDGMCERVAALTPVWPPGYKADYHAITYGWIVGETLRRADGRSVSQLLSEEICHPLGIRTLFCGLPAGEEKEVAFLENTAEYVPPHDAQPMAVPAWAQPLEAMMNRPDMQRSCLPGVSGIANARALARKYAALLPGGVDGVELLSQERVRLALEPQWVEEPPGTCSTWRLGYHPATEGLPPMEPVRAFGHGGYGGSMGFAYLDREMAVGFTRNLFQTEDSRERVFKVLHAHFPEKSQEQP